MQDHDQYRLFVHLAGSLSFTRTAADCHVSAATLSRAVQRLEAATGHRLVDRSPHGVALTGHGRRFLRYATEALDLWEGYREGGPEEDQLSGCLRLFATVTACQGLLPELLAPLRSAHPRVRVSLRTGDAAAALALLDDGEADLAVAALPDRVPATLLAREVTRTPLVLVRPHPGSEDACEEPFVLPRQGRVRQLADRWFRRRGGPPPVAVEADGHEALLTLVVLGYGTGIVPELVLEQSHLRERLHTVPVADPPEELTIGACVRRTDLHRPLIAAAWAAFEG